MSMDETVISDVIEFAGLRANVRRDGQAQNGINILFEGAPLEQLQALVAHLTQGKASLGGGDIYVEASLDARQRSELKRARAAQLSLTGSFTLVDVRIMPTGAVRCSGRLERLDSATPASALNGGRIIHVPLREREAAPESANRRTR